MNKNIINGTLALLFVLIVCISSAAAIDDIVTRDLPASVNAGASITVTLTVDVATSATYYLIDEVVPSEWAVTSTTDGGDYTTETGHVKWVVISGAADKVYSYTVTVPADASGAYTFGGIYMFGGATDTTSVLGDTAVTVSVEDTTTTIGAAASTTATPAPTTKPTAKPASAPATGGATTPDAPATKGLPGFEGAIAIAGLLAIACVMMRRK